MATELFPDIDVSDPEMKDAKQVATERFLDEVLLLGIRKQVFNKVGVRVLIPQLHHAFCKGAGIDFDLQKVLEVAEDRNAEYQAIRELEPERFNVFTATRTVTAILMLEEVLYVDDDTDKNTGLTLS